MTKNLRSSYPFNHSQIWKVSLHYVHCMFCVTVLPAFLKVLLIVMFETHCNICNICMLSFTVLPDFLTSVSSSSFFSYFYGFIDCILYL